MSPSATIRRLLLGLVPLLVVALVAPAASQAGQWVQVSCTNPDGTTAPSDGWSGQTVGAPPLGSQANTRCSPQVPMEAVLFSGLAAPKGAEEILQYTPPAGSTLVGGVLQLGLYGDGYGSGSHGYTWGSAGVFEPGSQLTQANVVKNCTQSQHLCQNGTDDYVGPLALPADAGGNLYLEATCNGFNASGACDTGGSHDAWALAELSSAQLLLHNNAAPTGSGFAGSVLAPNATGDASLGFLAGDPGGPGVREVIAQIDGHTLYAGVPNDYDGRCRIIGTDAATGAPMYDYQQPCPPSEPVLLSLPTAGFKDGAHTLVVTVVDAAGNASAVLAQRITTRNSGSTHTRLPGLRVRLVLSWHWNGIHTSLRAARASRLPRGARATVSCRGRGCPRLRLEGRHRLKPLLSALRNQAFRAGDHVLLTITAPGRAPERIVVTIRRGRLPSVKLRR